MDDAVSLYYFQELVQQLVFLEKNAHRPPLARTGAGIKLAAIQRGIEHQSDQAAQSGHGPMPILANQSRGVPDATAEVSYSYRGSVPDRDEFSISDYLHVELFDDGGSHARYLGDHEPPDPSAEWKDILPITVLLLASTVFAIVATLVIGK